MPDVDLRDFDLSIWLALCVCTPPVLLWILLSKVLICTVLEIMAVMIDIMAVMVDIMAVMVDDILYQWPLQVTLYATIHYMFLPHTL